MAVIARTTILRPLKEWLGEDEITPAQIEAVEAGALDTTRLYELIDAWRASASVPEIPHGEIRPFVSSRWSEMHKIPGLSTHERIQSKLGSLLGRMSTPSDAHRAVQLLSHHLLYTHGVAIEDPITGPDWHSVARQLNDTKILSARLSAAMTLLSSLEPLIDAGIVEVIPKLPMFDHELHTIMRLRIEDYLAAGGSDPAGPLPASIVEEARTRGIDERFIRSQRLGDLGLTIAENFSAMAAVDQHVDLYLPTRAHHELLRVLVADVASSYASMSAHAGPELEYLPTLLDVALPSVSAPELTAGDIVAIRRDGLFEDWRTALRDGLKDVASRAEQLRADPTYAMKDIREALRDQATRADQAVRESTFLGQLDKSKVQLSIGSGVAFGLIAAGAPPVAAAGVIGQLIGTVVNWLTARDKRPGQLAVVRHAALFADPV